MAFLLIFCVYRAIKLIFGDPAILGGGFDGIHARKPRFFILCHVLARRQQAKRRGGGFFDDTVAAAKD